MSDDHAARLTAAVRREYDRGAARYDRRWGRYVRRSLGLLRSALEGPDTGDLLDLGCGTAALLPRLVAWRSPVRRYVGVDPSAGMLRRAREKLASTPHPFAAALVRAEARALPFRSTFFDTVVTASALHYWCEPEEGLAEVRRVLRPGGRLLLVDWSRDSLRMRLLDLGMRLARTPYERMYSLGEVHGLLRGAGFRVESEERCRIGVVWELMRMEAV